MLLATLIGLALTSILSLAYSVPFKAVPRAGRQGTGIIGSIWCSVDTSTASIVPTAQDPGWRTTMSTCLGRLNAQDWNGTECVPASSNGTQLGPTFGFWKAQARYDIKEQMFPEACYARCAPCLQKGIDALHAVTTRCTFRNYPFGPEYSCGCDMGFDYGT